LQAQTPFTFVEDTDKIREAFAGAVGGLTSIVAQAVELTIAGQVQLKNINTPFPVRRTSDTSAVVTIPDIFAGERRDVLVELAAPTDADAQATLLEARVRYTDLRSGTLVQTFPVAMQARDSKLDTEANAQHDPHAL